MSADGLLKSGLSTYGTADLGVGDGGKSAHRVNSWLLTACVIISNSVGVASLDMPGAVAGFGGWLPGIVGLVFAVGMNVHMSIIIWRLYMLSPDKDTYVQVIVNAFSDLPEQQQKSIAGFAGMLQYGYIFSCLGWNLMVLADGLSYMFGGTLHVCLPTLMLVIVFCILPFQFRMRNFGSWNTLMFINLAVIAFITAIPIAYFASKGVQASRLPDSHAYMYYPAKFPSILSGLASTAFVLTTQYASVELFSEMQDPQEFPRSLSLSAPFQFLVLAFIGIGGYYFLGDTATAMVYTYVPFGVVLGLGGFCILFVLLLCELINGLILCKALHQWADTENEGKNTLRDWFGWTAIVISVYFSAWLFANMVPFFTDLADLLGTSFGPLSCYILPVCAYAWCHWRSESKGLQGKLAQISFAEWLLIALEFAVALTMTFSGSSVTLHRIISGWSSYGYPFQCHCQGIWDTCACSPTRPGMETCVGLT